MKMDHDTEREIERAGLYKALYEKHKGEDVSTSNFCHFMLEQIADIRVLVRTISEVLIKLGEPSETENKEPLP